MPKAIPVCPISWSDINKAVKADCGHTFEEKNLKRWVNTQKRAGQCPTCPLCRAPIITISPDRKIQIKINAQKKKWEEEKQKQPNEITQQKLTPEEMRRWQNPDSINNFLDKRGRTRTALHLFAQSGNLHYLIKAIQSGATIDCRNTEGNTPLYLAAISQHTNCCQELIERGASITELEKVPNALYKKILGNRSTWKAALYLANKPLDPYTLAILQATNHNEGGHTDAYIFKLFSSLLEKRLHDTDKQVCAEIMMQGHRLIYDEKNKIKLLEEILGMCPQQEKMSLFHRAMSLPKTYIYKKTRP